MVQGVKRRVSEEMAGAGAKKLIVSGPWDLEIPTNVILYERSPSLLPHPQPEVRIVMMRMLMMMRRIMIMRQMMRMLMMMRKMIRRIMTMRQIMRMLMMQVEVVRSQLMYKLRQSYQEMCHSREGIDAPKESFNR